MINNRCGGNPPTQRQNNDQVLLRFCNCFRRIFPSYIKVIRGVLKTDVDATITCTFLGSYETWIWFDHLSRLTIAAKGALFTYFVPSIMSILAKNLINTLIFPK
jgi:hypothetical protein